MFLPGGIDLVYYFFYFIFFYKEPVLNVTENMAAVCEEMKRREAAYPCPRFPWYADRHERWLAEEPSNNYDNFTEKGFRLHTNMMDTAGERHATLPTPKSAWVRLPKTYKTQLFPFTGRWSFYFFWLSLHVRKECMFIWQISTLLSLEAIT